MPQPHPRISVVIPAYKRREGILTLLEDLSLQDFPSFETIIVEDCGNDGTVPAVLERYPRTICISNSTNSGPAVSRNRGILSANGDIVLGLDSDVRIPDRSLLSRLCIKFDQYPQIAGYAFRLLSPDGISDDSPRWWHPLPLDRFSTSSFLTDYFSGTAYAFRKQALIDAKLFPEVLYMHYEEVVLSLRLISLGHLFYYSPDLTVVHNEGKVSRRTEVKTFLKARNQVLLTLLCYPPLRALKYLPPRLLYNLVQSLINGHIGGYFRALFSAARLAPRCFRERTPIPQKAWVLIRSLPQQSPNGEATLKGGV